MKANNLKLDYALTCFFSMLALYGAGAGVSNVPIALFLMAVCLSGIAFSYFVSAKLKIKQIDSFAGIVYALIAAAVIFFIVPLNRLLPDGGFPSELMIASIMSWFIALGAFAAWSEGVLLFQAIPTLSLLSMVGIWDTYSGAVLSFVLFLLSVTVLLSRAHNRAMLKQAEESGYGKIEAISRGPWKRMAGPEWVLGFAMGVIILSSIGAPFVQNAFRPFAGNFRASLPRNLVKNLTNIDPLIPPSTQQTSVGTGPHTPGNQVMLLAELDQPRYLKDGFFELYTGTGWQKDRNAFFPDDRVWQENGRIYRKVFSQKKLKKPEVIEYMILPLVGTINRVPVPGDAFELRQEYAGNDSAKLRRRDSQSTLPRYYGKSYVPNPDVPIRDKAVISDPLIRDAYTMVSTTDRVRQLAERIAGNHRTDYGKAMAIKQEIENTAKYNLKAAAVPVNQDAVDFFMFDSKEGYCDLFATAMVVMSRCAGIPARYVTGYYPINDEKDGMGRTVLRSSERHAWAELFFEGVGWIPFDATEGALEINGNERGGTGIKVPWYQTKLFQTLINAVLILAVGGLVLLAFSDKVKLARLFGRNRPGAAPVDRSALVRRQIGAQYALLSRAIARSTGIARSPQMSPTEYAAVSAAKLPGVSLEVSELTGVYVAAMYSSATLDDSDLARLKEQTKALRSKLKSIRPEGARHPLAAALMLPVQSAALLVKTICHLKAQDKRDQLGS